MDPAVGLVQAYLRANGYFTVTEAPVIHRVASNDYRALTDIDILAVRFPGATRYVPGGEDNSFELAFAMDDAALRHEADQIEIIIGEVKEGRAELNRSATHPGVMRAALLRFGIDDNDEIESLIDGLRRDGEAVSTSGYRVRLFAFGSYPGHRTNKYKIILMRQMFDYFFQQADNNAEMYNAAQFKDSTLGVLALALKAGLRRNTGSGITSQKKRH